MTASYDRSIENPKDRFWQLVDRSCSAQLSEGDVLEFERLLVDNRELQAAYLAHLDLCVDVARLSQATNACEKAVAAIDRRLTARGPQRQSPPGLLSACLTPARNLMSRPLYVSCVASLLVVTVSLIVLAQIYLGGPSLESSFPDERFVHEDPVSFGVLVSADGPVWESSLLAKRVGDIVCVGETLTLKRGWIDLRLPNQAVIRLQNASQLRISGRNTVELLSGTLAARVPPKAKGFTVETRSARIVDFGTEFGVAVNAVQTSFVRVFQGSVEVSREENGSELFRKTLTAGESLTVYKTGRTLVNSVESKTIPRVELFAERDPDLLFFDTFATSLDVPFHSRPFHNRSITGTLAVPRSAFFRTTGDCSLLARHDDDHRGVLRLKKGAIYSPRCDFDSEKIKRAGGVEIDLTMAITGEDEAGEAKESHWFGLRLLTSERHRVSSWKSITGVQFHFFRSGVYSLYENGKRTDESGARPAFTDKKQGWHQIKITVLPEKGDGASPATIVCYANGDPTPFLTYRTKHAYRDNFIALEYYDPQSRKDGSSLVDSVRVSLLGK